MTKLGKTAACPIFKRAGISTNAVTKSDYKGEARELVTNDYQACGLNIAPAPGGTLDDGLIGLLVNMEFSSVVTLAVKKEFIGIKVWIDDNGLGAGGSTLDGDIFGIEIVMGLCNQTLASQDYAFIHCEVWGWGNSLPTSVICVTDLSYGTQSRIAHFIEVGRGLGWDDSHEQTGDYWISKLALTNSNSDGAVYNDAAIKVHLGDVDYWIPLFNSHS